MRSVALTAENVGTHLPEAVALRAGRDDQLARALGPTLESAFTESVHRNPHQIAEAIYPTLGPAIRKAIAEAIGGLVTSINRALEESFSWRGLKWRVEAWRSGVRYSQVVMKHALVYRVEQAYLIHAETGLLLSHVTAPDLKAPDADVISGMLTAIRDFVGDSFKSGGDGALHTFTVGDVTVLVESGPRALLAAIVRGQHPPALRERLQETLELLHFQFAGALARFDGDAVGFGAAKPLLAECLETVVDPVGRKNRGLVPRVAWVLAFVVVAAAVYLGIASYRRWRSALDALRHEPGLVVLSANRGLRHWHITGLEDPLAHSAGRVLARLGVDTAHVRGSWAPYISADPAIVVRRIQQTLSPPPGAELQLAGDTLVVRGSAPVDWLDRARAQSLPGVGAFRDADVSPTLPALLQPLADSIAAAHVLFETGSARISDAAGRLLGGIAASVRALQSGLGPSWRAQLDVVGRTDTTGSEGLNRALSDDRARAATDALVRAGIGAHLVAPRGIGTSDPLPAGTLEERARMNRSVSFAVRVRRAQPGEERVR
jgi:OOP family OmpA-OmpF porin